LGVGEWYSGARGGRFAEIALIDAAKKFFGDSRLPAGALSGGERWNDWKRE